jgi:hypothetical protein
MNPPPSDIPRAEADPLLTLLLLLAVLLLLLLLLLLAATNVLGVALVTCTVEEVRGEKKTGENEATSDGLLDIKVTAAAAVENLMAGVMCSSC